MQKIFINVFSTSAWRLSEFEEVLEEPKNNCVCFFKSNQNEKENLNFKSFKSESKFILDMDYNKII